MISGAAKLKARQATPAKLRPTQQKTQRRARSPPPPPIMEAESEEEEEQQEEEEDEQDEQEEEEEAESQSDSEAAEAADAAEAAAQDEEDEEAAEGEDEEAAAGEQYEDAEAEHDDVADGDDAPQLNDEGNPHADSLDSARSSSSKPSLATDEYAQALSQRGVVYVSRVPPYMKAAKLRWLLEKLLPAHKKRNRIGRIFLTPEDAAAARRRKKAGGNSGARFVDGWVEFESKKIARWLAESYNNTPMGGPKRSRYAEDLWNLKYLSGFKWHHLTEKIAYEKQVRSTRIREEMSQAKRESEHYLSQVEASRKAQQIAEKRQKKRKGEAEDSEQEPKRQRNFHQRSLIDKPAASKKK